MVIHVDDYEKVVRTIKLSVSVCSGSYVAALCIICIIDVAVECLNLAIYVSTKYSPRNFLKA